MKTVFKVFLGVIIALIVLAIGGIALTAFTAQKAVTAVDTSIKQEQSKTDNKDQLLQDMLSKAKPVETKTDYDYTVEYTLTNNTKETFDYVQLNADVFDKSGTKLGNDMTNITDIKPGQTFKLKLDLYQDGAASYKITGIYSTSH